MAEASPTRRARSPKTAAPAHPDGPAAVISAVRFRRAHRCFAARRTLRFEPGVNLLVGDQGTGKSTLIGLLRQIASERDYERERAKQIISVELARPGPVWAFDFESDNPRTRSAFGDDVRFQIAAMFASHGQTALPLLERLLAGEQAHTGLVILDEPDTALSPRSARRLVALLDAHAAAGGQSIVAVHNPLVIASQERVLSLEHKRWMRSQTFLAAHEEPARP